MYVCICHAVKESDLRQAVDRGICTWKRAVKDLPIASQCGKCARDAHALFNEAVAARLMPPP